MAKKIRRNDDSRGKKHKGDPTPARRARMSGKKRAVPKTHAPSQIVQRARALNVLAWCHGTIEMLLEDFPVDKATYQPSPGANHALWTIGHLAVMYYAWAAMIDGKKRDLPLDYAKLFGFGSKPTSLASDYPSWADVRAAHDKAYEIFVGVVAQQNDANLAKPLHGDSTWLADNRLDAIFKLAYHEGWHHGQLSYIRRSLGLKAIF